MVDVHKIADEAEVIIDGYAVSRCGAGCRVMNLNMPDKVTVFSKDGIALETTMDDIELHIAQKHFLAAQKYMEA